MVLYQQELERDGGTRSFQSWRKGSFPIDWVATFASSGPLHVEIGFGDGRFLTDQAKVMPTARFVGLEISGASLYRAARRVRRDCITNIRLLKVDAQFGLRHLFVAREVSSVVINCPDPWPKERHRTNRLLRGLFLQIASSRLKSLGKIKLATDHPGYLAAAEEEVAASGLFKIIRKAAPAEVLGTKYAQKWTALEKPIYYREFENRGLVQEKSLRPLERVKVMPHAILKGKLSKEPGSFEKSVRKYADGHVILHEVAKTIGVDKLRWIFRVTVNDPELVQQLLVVVHPRPDSNLIVRLETFGDPVVTPTVRGAVHVVTEWLLGTVPGLVLVERNY